jgi:type I restriction enzyme, R subunit
MSLSEADTRAKLIDPALHSAGWTEDLIKREETAMPIDIVGGKAKRVRRGRTDYTLRVKISTAAQPVAVALIEAKADHLPPDHGLEQGKLYSDCKRLNVKFVYATNGHLFVEYDLSTGLTSEPKPLSEFPTPTELRARYEKQVGFNLESERAKPLLQPYTGGEAQRRYYQDAAIRATLEKIARGEKRALLALATGAGKTFIAVNLLKRIADAGQLTRALFVCDRDELRTQAGAAFRNQFGANAQEVSSQNAQKNARILIATYQTLDVASEEESANFLKDNYPEDYFSHIIIDEAHRSAWGKWSEVFRRNPNAVQIGLTATPRKLRFTEKDSKEVQDDLQITADNLKHFGDPVYEYTIAQGIEDGYLAACEIVKRYILINASDRHETETGIARVDLSKTRLTDAITGQELTPEEVRERYEAVSFEKHLILPDRISEMANDLFQYLLETGGPEQKTIIFCAGDRHAQLIATAMGNLYADWCSMNGQERAEHYSFKCTAKGTGNEALPDFRGSSRSYFIATTVDLLTTGVDVPSVRNIVFFRYIRSPILFYQMFGRGTRIDLTTSKLMFRVYDYTNATRLFGEDFITRDPTTGRPKIDAGHDDEIDQETEDVEHPVRAEGIAVQIIGDDRLIPTSIDGKQVLLTVEEYRRELARKLIEQAATLDKFRARWILPDERRALINSLLNAGLPPTTIQLIGNMIEYDLYDVLAELGYGLNPRTKRQRVDAFTYKHEDWLDKLPEKTRNTVKAIAEQFVEGGTEGLESQYIFQVPTVQQAGGAAALGSAGKKPVDLLRETKERMFAA